jgi:hypothetical protein
MFFASDRKWKALLGRDAGSHESARTHSRLQNLQATSRKTVKVSPHGYSGGSRWSTSLAMRPSITSPEKRYFFRLLLIVPGPANLVADLLQLSDIRGVHAFSETGEDHLFDGFICLQPDNRFSTGDLDRCIDRIAVNAATDGGSFRFLKIGFCSAAA